MEDVDVNVLVVEILEELESIIKDLAGIYDDMVLKKACEDMINNIDVMEKRGG